MHIALVTADPRSLPADVARVMARADRPLVAALEAAGAVVSTPVWSDETVAWERFDLALVRTTWDYPARRDAFVAWAADAAARTRVCNPPDVLRWNSHKSYLLELEDRGAPIVPTAWLGHGDRIDLGELLEARGWRRAVVKPAVGSGALGMARVGPGGAPVRGDPTGGASRPAGRDELGPAAAQEHLEGLLAAGDVLVQPFLSAVTDRGELSVIVVDGEVSHAVRKVPPAGEFRVHETYGGRYRAEVADREVATLARWVVDATGADVFLARVDLIEDDTGAHQVVEVEAVEPDLYLGTDPAAATPLAAAILDRAGG